MEKLKRSICLINGSFNIFYKKEKRSFARFFLADKRTQPYNIFSGSHLSQRNKNDELKSSFSVVTKV